MRLAPVALALWSLACSTPLEPVVGEPGTESPAGPLFLEDADILARPSPMPTLPHAAGDGALSPWGGTDAQRWRPEAVLANAVSDALNRAWRVPGVQDVVVAVPVHLLSSTFHEYGDGQSNAAVTFNAWPGRRPPVVATQLRMPDGTAQVHFRLDAGLPITTLSLEVYREQDGAASGTLPLTVAADGARVTTWTPPADLGDGIVLVRPRGWNDWFPVRFTFPVRGIASLKATVPADWQRFGDGGDIVDHEGVSVQGRPGLRPFNLLMNRVMSPAYDALPYTPASIHARFPSPAGDVVTGVGRGWTWVAHAPAAPFKIMYTCFEQRRADLEASAPHGGVVSGAGWHLIGDPAETILNDLENAPIAVAFGTRNVWPASLLPSGGFAWGLGDVATFRFLRPGEAFVTARGGQLTDEDGGVWPQDNFHWFFFQQDAPVCTEEWVHPCVPGDALGFACGDVTVPITVDDAFTQFGQEVRLVGSAPELGGWNPAAGIRLAPTEYPRWRGAVSLPRGSVAEVKFVKVDAQGQVVWEEGPNRTLQVPLDGEAVVQGTWR